MPQKLDPNRWYYVPTQIAPIINVDCGNWTRTVRENPSAVPWSVIVCGSYLKFPKAEVDRYLTDWGLPLPNTKPTE